MRAASCIVFLLGVGCSSGSSGGAPKDAGANDSGSGGTAADTGVDAAPTGPCARFVSCSLAVQPDTAAGTRAAYGPDGACWKTQTPEACDKACVQGTQALHAIAPTAPECATCSGNQECQSPTPICNTTIGACAECNSASDCGGGLPACDTQSGKCVKCASDSDCSGALSHCDPASHECVECVSGSHCSSSKCETDHTCCVKADPCYAGTCGTLYDNCGAQVNCGECSGGEVCNANLCEAVSSTFECNAGGTNNTCTKYQQYCQYYFNGPGGTTAWCSTMPASCVANPTCACLASANEFYPPDTCSAGTGPQGAGTLYVTSKP